MIPDTKKKNIFSFSKTVFFQVKEIQDLKDKQAELNSHLLQKNVEMYALKDENVRISNNFTKTVVENQTLRSQCEHLRARIKELESKVSGIQTKSLDQEIS